MSLRPINSKKHIVGFNGILGAVTNTVIENIIDDVDTYTLADANGVPTGSRVNGFYHSSYFISEGGEATSEVPLVDWYIIHSPGGAFGTTFDADNLPTPGATGVHKNKRFIIHEERGLTGGGNASLAGVPMVFKGVIGIPKKWRRVGDGDNLVLCARCTFATKVCTKSVYKHFS